MTVRPFLTPGGVTWCPVAAERRSTDFTWPALTCNTHMQQCAGVGDMVQGWQRGRVWDTVALLAACH